MSVRVELLPVLVQVKHSIKTTVDEFMKKDVILRQAAEVLHNMEGSLFKTHYDRVLYQKKAQSVCDNGISCVNKLATFCDYTEMDDMLSLRLCRLVHEGVQPFVFPEDFYGSTDGLLRTQILSVIDTGKRISEGFFDDVYFFKYATVGDGPATVVKTADTTGLEVPDRRLAYTVSIVESIVSVLVTLVRQRSMDSSEIVSRIFHSMSNGSSELEDMKVAEVMDKSIVRESVSTRLTCLRSVLAK